MGSPLAQSATRLARELLITGSTTGLTTGSTIDLTANPAGGSRTASPGDLHIASPGDLNTASPGDLTRWHHSCAVAARAGEAAGTVPAPQRAVLLAAAWLHDIGYAPGVRDTGFHPLDGARYLRAHHWPEPIPTLVAHHSGARYVIPFSAAAGADLLGEFPIPHLDVGAGSDARSDAYSNAGAQGDAPSWVGFLELADALTWADQSTCPDGQPSTLDQRLEDMLRRHGPGSPNARAHRHREAHLRGALDRVEARRAAMAAMVPMIVESTSR